MADARDYIKRINDTLRSKINGSGSSEVETPEDVIELPCGLNGYSDAVLMEIFNTRPARVKIQLGGSLSDEWHVWPINVQGSSDNRVTYGTDENNYLSYAVNKLSKAFTLTNDGRETNMTLVDGYWVLGLR